MTQHRGRRITAGAGAFLLIATACSGPTNDWTFHGDPVREVGESLTTIEERFRSEIADAEISITVPDDAGCYLQVADDTIIAEDVICGPLRIFGAEETMWLTAPLAGMKGQGDEVRLYVEDDAEFETGSPSTNATTVDASGNEVDTSREVEAPKAPPAAVGDVIPLDPAADEDTESAVEPFEISTPDAEYRIARAGVREYVGSDTDPTGPPEGGALVAMEVTRNARQNAPTSPVSSATIRAGGKDIEVPDGYAAVAVEGDGSDAVIAVEYDGNVQEFSLATGELVSGHPYTAQSFTPVNAPQDTTVGEREGSSTKVRQRVRTVVASWDEERSWAPEGKDRAYIALSLDTRSEFRSGNDTVDYDVRKYTVKDVSITADGQEIAVDPASVALEPRADGNYEDLDMVAMIVVDVPIGTQEISVGGSIELTATIEDNNITAYQRDHAEGEPEAIQHTLELAPVTMMPER